MIFCEWESGINIYIRQIVDFETLSPGHEEQREIRGKHCGSVNFTAQYLTGNQIFHRYDPTLFTVVFLVLLVQN